MKTRLKLACRASMVAMMAIAAPTAAQASYTISIIFPANGSTQSPDSEIDIEGNYSYGWFDIVPSRVRIKVVLESDGRTLRNSLATVNTIDYTFVQSHTTTPFGPDNEILVATLYDNAGNQLGGASGYDAVQYDIDPN